MSAVRRVAGLALGCAASVFVGGVVAGVAGGCSSAGAPWEATGQTSAAIDSICGEAPSATLDGIPSYAYCGNFNVWTNNGVDTRSSSGGAGWTQTEGGYGYQCVEFAVRYFYFKWSVTHGWFVGYAKDMCGNHPGDVSVTSNPVHGDLAVFTPGCAGADSTAGHVAGINTVSPTTIGVVQENPGGTMTWPRSCVMCYLHAAGNGGMVDPCSTAPVSGLYCGQSNQWGGGTPDVLYDCENGVTASKTVCQYGCHLAPFNTNDSCNPAPPPPPDAGPGDAGHDAGVDAGEGGAKLPADAGPMPHGDAGVAPVGDDAGGDSAGPPPGSSGGCAVAAEGGSKGAAWLWALGVLAGLGVIERRRRRAR